MADNGSEANGNVPTRFRKLRRFLAGDRGHRLGGGFALERAPAREHLVEDHAEGKNVGSMIGGVSSPPLPGHKTDPAHPRPRVRATGRRGSLRADLAPRAG